MRSHLKFLVPGAFTALLLGGCGSSDTTPTGSGGAAATGASGSGSATAGGTGGAAMATTTAGGGGAGGGETSSGSSGTGTGGGGGFGTIFTILLENHDYKEIVGSPNAPYINSLIDKNGLASSYQDSLLHPSLPNYHIQNNPALCADRDVDFSLFAADLAAGTYQYMWITPNLLSDGHDPTSDPVTGLKQSDAWLAAQVPKILASSAYKNNGILFITWDEAEGRNGDSKDQVPMIVLSPKLKSPGMKVGTALSHASYLRTIEDIYGISSKLGAAQNATSLMEFFTP